MSSGFHQGMAISDMAHGIARTAASGAHRAGMELAVVAVERAYETVAELASEKVALRAALAKFDPKHPLLVDEALCDRMHQAGAAAYRKVKDSDDINWSKIAHAGDAIEYDYTPPTLDEIALALISRPDGSTAKSIDEPVEIPTHGLCPNCGVKLSLSADECPKCRAMFGAGSAWEIKPIV